MDPLAFAQRHVLSIASAVALTTGLTAACSLEPTQLFGFLVAVLLSLLGVGWLVVVLAVWITGRLLSPRPAEDRRRLQSEWTLRLLLVGISLVAVTPGSIAVHHLLSYRARCWVESITPALDEYCRAHGHPPKSLDAIELNPWTRAYLDRLGQIRYVACDDGSYAFDIVTGLTSGWGWGSTRRVWTHYT